MDLNTSAWWRNSIGYIIYPETFADSNGDGVGDLNGILSKLDYLRDLGVNLLWVCPFFQSPMDDNGYDVSDYYAVNPRFGTMKDFDNLLAEAHKRGIRIIIDFTLNHTSDQHPWFQKALQDPSSPERKYYFFQKGKIVDGKVVAPNNWKGFFASSAWERVPGTEDFYLHIFSKHMPDVNWANPALREEYFKIANFYLDKGVDGFRLDAVAHLAKDLSFSDSALKPDASGYVLDTSKFSNRPELFDYLQEFKSRCLQGRNVLMVGEVGGNISPEEALTLCDRNYGSINLVFNFDTVWNNGNYNSIGKKDDEIKTDVLLLKRNFMRWYNADHEKADMPLYWCNHDHPRVLSQYGSVKYRDESAKMLITTLLFLYGTPFVYYGDEIGMSNVQFAKPEQFFSDKATESGVAEWRRSGFTEEQIVTFLNRATRLNARTPMQWDDTKNAGFSKAESLIIPANPNYAEGVNVQKEMEDPYSILNFFQFAINKRRDAVINDIVSNGPLDLIDPNHPDVFAYLHSGSQKLMVISNFRPYDVFFTFYYEIADVMLHNYGDLKIVNHIFQLRPFESYLIRIR
jgi:glycosidase